MPEYMTIPRSVQAVEIVKDSNGLPWLEEVPDWLLHEIFEGRVFLKSESRDCFVVNCASFTNDNIHAYPGSFIVYDTDYSLIEVYTAANFHKFFRTIPEEIAHG